MKQSITLSLLLFLSSALLAQPSACYWQQSVSYTMDIDFDSEKHQFKGTQKLVYTNASPDVLSKVFYHLYFNAFQPGSAMDIRSRTIADPDGRIGSRIAELSESEIGYQKIKSLKQDGKKLDFEIVGTVMEVTLAAPIQPGATTMFEMEFESQVPEQIRRSGRFNKEGVDYTLTQWYPKMAEYDHHGWHTSPYIGREFHGVFGSFDVTIHMDSSYVIAGTGILQNPSEIGHGYIDRGTPLKRPEGSKLHWHFMANKVHDFAWAADPDYRHKKTAGPDGTTLHFFNRDTTSLNTNWDKLVPYTVRLFEIMNARFGKYPYKQFSVIQGGDGGMEYPMCTMIVGGGKMSGLVSVTVHEAIHNWYYGVLASNESKYPWMDEGFTSYAQDQVLDSLFSRDLLNPSYRDYRGYAALANTGNDEPLTTHADHYDRNKHYGVNAYSKGNIFLHQLSYIVGQEVFDKAMLTYWNEWQFKHPAPDDFKRVLENASGIELDWYFENWVGTTKKIDFGIRHLVTEGKKTKLIIERKGNMPMPVEVEVLTEKGSTVYYIPLEIMRGEKQSDYPKGVAWKQQKDWPWVYEFYELIIDEKLENITSITLDPMQKVADINPSDNTYPSSDEIIFDSSAP